MGMRIAAGARNGACDRRDAPGSAGGGNGCGRRDRAARCFRGFDIISALHLHNSFIMVQYDKVDLFKRIDRRNTFYKSSEKEFFLVPFYYGLFC